MPAKMARSAPRPPFGAPGMTAIVRAARRSCDNEGKSAKFKRNRGSSGESRRMFANWLYARGQHSFRFHAALIASWYW